MSKLTVFIDESGTLPDVTDKFIVMSALITAYPEQLARILSKFRKKTPKKGSRKNERLVPEFKFHYVGQLTRQSVLTEINRQNIRIYILVVDKMGRKIADTPTNYFKLVRTLIGLVLGQEQEVGQIILDSHFNVKVKSLELGSSLKSTFPDVKIMQADSKIDSRIDLADFVAGAVLRKYNKQDLQFVDIFADQIKIERVIRWNGLN